MSRRNLDKVRVSAAPSAYRCNAWRYFLWVSASGFSPMK